MANEVSTALSGKTRPAKQPTPAPCDYVLQSAPIAACASYGVSRARRGHKSTPVHVKNPPCRAPASATGRFGRGHETERASPKRPPRDEQPRHVPGRAHNRPHRRGRHDTTGASRPKKHPGTRQESAMPRQRERGQTTETPRRRWHDLFPKRGLLARFASESGLLARLAFSRKRDNSPRLMGGISSRAKPALSRSASRPDLAQPPRRRACGPSGWPVSGP